GNDQVVLCERGIRAFSEETRNTLDLAAVPVLRTMTHLPIIVDPSHATGRADLVRPLARAAAAVGADGVMVEVHVRPEEALCDANQAILPEELGALAADCDAIRAALRPGAEIVAGA
ncbi:MAG: 3-deoxy-7-phosphoheptulonate synthase, partial [Planctomycetota bacterium]